MKSPGFSCVKTVKYWLSVDTWCNLFHLYPYLCVKIIKITEPKRIAYIYCGSAVYRWSLLHSAFWKCSIPRSSLGIISRPESNGYIPLTPDARPRIDQIMLWLLNISLMIWFKWCTLHVECNSVWLFFFFQSILIICWKYASRELIYLWYYEFNLKELEPTINSICITT